MSAAAEQMRGPHARTLTDVLDLVVRSPRNEAWISPEEFAAVVQRLAGVNGMSFGEIQALLSAPGLNLEGYGLIRRFEWVDRGEAPDEYPDEARAS